MWQMMPDYLLKSEDSSTEDDLETEIFQTWQESGSCPEGTIPIRRILREDLLRATSLHSFGRKFPQPRQNVTANQIKEFIPQNRSVSVDSYLQLRMYFEFGEPNL